MCVCFNSHTSLTIFVADGTEFTQSAPGPKTMSRKFR